MKDNNRPEGFYGELYDRETGSKVRSNLIDRPLVGFSRNRGVEELLQELNKKI